MVQSSFINNLYKKYGTDRATATTAGEYTMVGDMHVVEAVLTLSALTETETIVADTTFLPAGMRIQNVELLTVTAAATGVAIDVGLIKVSDRSTEVDYDGLLAAAPTAVMDLAGERTVYTAATTVPASATGTGALIGTTLAYNSHISASRTTATAFTAGVVKLRITMFKP